MSATVAVAKSSKRVKFLYVPAATDPVPALVQLLPILDVGMHVCRRDLSLARV